MKRDELLSELFGGVMPILAGPCDRWMAASPRFAAFSEANRGKIRKKARLAMGDPERAIDLLRELEVAYLLLGRPQLALEYEAYAAEKVRGPDFTVMYKGHTRFNVEVKRLRRGERALAARVEDAVGEKLRQMPPSIANLLWLATEDDAALDLPATMKRLVRRAETDDMVILARYRFAGKRDFWAGWQRLSAVVVLRAVHEGGAEATFWANPQAKHALPRELAAWLTA